MQVIADSSSLILLTKSELLIPLAKKTKLTIPRQVYKEVVEEGLRKNFTDAIKIKEYVESGKIGVKSVSKKREFPITLGKGEKEALELFYQEKADKIMVDDKKALNVCRALKISYITAHSVLIDLFGKKIIDKNQALKSLETLNKQGRYSSEITLYCYDRLNRVK